MNNMTVKELKDILKTLPDDMDVIIPVIDIDDVNDVKAFRHIRTAGVLEDIGEEHPALCLNSAANGVDISTQIQQSHHSTTTTCKQVLF